MANEEHLARLKQLMAPENRWLPENSHSIGFSGGACHCSSKASRGEDLEVEEPVACRDFASFDFHTTSAGVLGATLVGDEVVQVCQSCKKRPLAPMGMMECFHHKELPVDGIMRLIK